MSSMKNKFFKSDVENIAVEYGRMSSNMQKEESIETQFAIIDDYAKRNKIRIIGQYTDLAETATETKNRDGLLQLIEDSKSKKFGKVLVYKFDRFSRDTTQFYILEQMLTKNNVELISVTQPIPDGPQGIQYKNMLITMGDSYSQNLGLDVVQNKKLHHKNGNFSGGHIPLGYKKDRRSDKFVIDVYESKIVKKIFELYSQGYGYNTICKMLKDMNYKTKFNKEFQKSSLKYILTNEIYIGKYIYNKESTIRHNGIKKTIKNPKEEWIINKDLFPAIIDTNLFNAIQQMIKNYQTQAKSRKKRYDYILTSKITCGVCGRAYTGASNKGSGQIKLNYYRCTCKNSDAHTKCRNRMIRAELLEDYVIDLIKKEIYTDDKIKKYTDIIYTYFNKNSISNDGKIAQLEKTLEEEYDNQDKLYERLEAKTISEELFRRRNEKIEKKIIEIKNAIEQLKSESSVAHSRESISSYLKNIKRKLNNKSTEIRMLINSTIDKIIINHDSVDIHFKLFDDVDDDDIFNLSDYVSKVQFEPSNCTIDTLQFIFYKHGFSLLNINIDRNNFII